MRRKSIKQLRDELGQAEAELEAATKRTKVNAAAKRVDARESRAESS